MSITREEIIKIAHLARIAIQNDEIDHYAEDLSNVLHLVTQMDKIDTSAIVPLAHPIEEAEAHLRDDRVTELNMREELQALSEYSAQGYYLVPSVIEEES